MARMTLGKGLYAGAFVVALPILLALWAVGAEANVALPVFGQRASGAACAAAGLLLTAAGMRDLWRLGGGLPMNAFPPPRLVKGGTY